MTGLDLPEHPSSISSIFIETVPGGRAVAKARTSREVVAFERIACAWAVGSARRFSVEGDCCLRGR
jgi:hypothetical protein